MKQIRASIIVTTFNRDHLLKWALKSLAEQDIRENIDILVVNDGKHGETQALATEYGARYAFLGQRNDKGEAWRSQGVSLNEGVPLLQSDNIIISAGEMCCLDVDCVRQMVEVLESDPKAIAVPLGRDDWPLDYTTKLEATGKHDLEAWGKLKLLNTKIPFFMGLKQHIFTDIGGYDNQYVGHRGWDDVDFVGRLLLYGCHYVQTTGRVVHLYHTRSYQSKLRLPKSQELYEKMLGTVYRNGAAPK